jgi:2'-5' RNA ligase
MNEDIDSDSNVDAATNAAQETESERETPNTSATPSRRHHRRPKEPRPDHFLALRLSHDPSVLSTIISIQNAIAQHSPHLQPAFIDPISSHLTLGVLHLPGKETKLAAQAALLDAATAAAITTPFSVTLQGVGTFRDQVLFLKIAEEEEEQGTPGLLRQLAEVVRNEFKQQGFLLQAHQEFIPHVTIAKTSKMQPFGGGQNNNNTGRRNNFKNKNNQEQQRLSIPAEAYQSVLSSVSTSRVEITEIQICAMEEVRKPGEYYKVIASVPIYNNSNNNNRDKQL